MSLRTNERNMADEIRKNGLRDGDRIGGTDFYVAHCLRCGEFFGSYRSRFSVCEVCLRSAGASPSLSSDRRSPLPDARRGRMKHPPH